MKKILLSLAVAAMAMPTIKAQTLNDILGIYSGTYLGYDVNNGYATYDGFLDNVEIEAGDEADEVVIYDLFPEFPGASVTATYDESSHILTLPEQTLEPNRYLVMFDWGTEDWADVAEFDVAADGTISMLNELIEFYVIDDDMNYYMNNAEIVLYLEEHTGNQPGEEPGGETGGTEMVIDVDSTEHSRFLSGEFVANDPSAFFAKIETLDNPLVTIECENVGSGDLPFLNDIAESDLGWYTLYGGNGGGNIPQYNIYVPEGYVITKITATLYSVEGRADVNWYFDDEMFTSSSEGTEVEYTCNSPIVYITTDDAGVTPTEYADFVITVAEEGSTAVKGLESVDANAPVVFYDLQGRKVANPTKGIFIRQQGGNASKVVVK